jgi:RimJ/RimL family protein N-acetyltransferase
VPGPIELRTERLDLARWTTADADVAAFFSIWGDPRVIWWGPCADHEHARATIERTAARCAGQPALGWWAMIDRKTGAIAGNACIQPAPVPDGETEIGWHVAYAQQGKGYATEAARALVAHAFAHGLARLIAEVVPLNFASIAIARKLRMRPEGMVMRAGCEHVIFALEPAPLPR